MIMFVLAYLIIGLFFMLYKSRDGLIVSTTGIAVLVFFWPLILAVYGVVFIRDVWRS